MAYEGIGWENAPSKKTPLNAENLNTMDRVIVFDNGIIQKLITGTHEGGQNISGTAVVHYSDTQNLKQKLDEMDATDSHAIKDTATEFSLTNGSKTNTISYSGMSVVGNSRENKSTFGNTIKVENTYSGIQSSELKESGLVLQNRSDYTNTLATESGMEKNAFTMLPKEGGLLATAESVDDLATNVENLKVLGYTIPSECPVQNEISNGKIIQKVGRINLASLTWSYDGTSKRFIAKVAGRKGGYSNFVCDSYEYNMDAYLHDSGVGIEVPICICGYPTVEEIIIRDNRCTNVADFVALNVSTYLYYELATPITHSIENTIINDDLKMLGYTVPIEMPIQNYTSNGIFHQRVGRVDLGSLNWRINNAQASRYMFYADANIVYKHPSNDRTVPSVYANGYKSESAYDVARESISSNKAVSVENDTNYNRIYVADTRFDGKSGSEVKQMLQGTYLYYELATEQTKSVDGNEAIRKRLAVTQTTNGGYIDIPQLTDNAVTEVILRDMNGFVFTGINYQTNMRFFKVCDLNLQPIADTRVTIEIRYL